MSCCENQSIEAQFGSARAHEELARYLKKGAERTTRQLVNALRRTGMTGASLIDIGSGIGIIHHELLGAEIAKAIHVEASSAYIAEAKSESERRGHGHLTQFFHGDFVNLAQIIPAADVVTLDRVVCCYPDYEQLMEQSLSKARRWYGISYPRDWWYVQLDTVWSNFRRRRKGNPFRTYVHPPAEIERLIQAHDFQLVFKKDTPIWRTALYERRRQV
jgi:magnesium-protoporphyrin O-methyltransferase